MNGKRKRMKKKNNNSGKQRTKIQETDDLYMYKIEKKLTIEISYIWTIAGKKKN